MAAIAGLVLVLVVVAGAGVYLLANPRGAKVDAGDQNANPISAVKVEGSQTPTKSASASPSASRRFVPGPPPPPRVSTPTVGDDDPTDEPSVLDPPDVDNGFNAGADGVDPPVEDIPPVDPFEENSLAAAEAAIQSEDIDEAIELLERHVGVPGAQDISKARRLLEEARIAASASVAQEFISRMNDQQRRQIKKRRASTVLSQQWSAVYRRAACAGIPRKVATRVSG